MRLGIVSDIHCNAPGLQLAIDRMGDVDQLLCAGDIMNEYRFSNEVIEILRDRGALCVLGNHDMGLLAPHGERARAAPTIKEANLRYLAEQPLSREMVVDGKTLLMTHATPFPPHSEYVYAGSPELARFGEVAADYIVVGHTHAQMALRVGRALVINPGSAGDGRDYANGRRHSYAVLDTDTDSVTFDDYEVGDEARPQFIARA
jgi:putative phosphoesterase